MIQLVIALAVMVICLYFKYVCSYWTRRKIDGPSPLPIFGNLFEFIITKKKHFGEIYEEIYSSYPKARYVGFYKMQKPAILIRDLELVKEVLVTKFNIFNKNDFSINPLADPLLAVNPFLVPGDEWKQARTHLSPLFTASRNKVAIPFINAVAKSLLEYIEMGPESQTSEFEVKDLCAKFTTDVVAAVAFGLDGQSFTNPDADFRRMGDDVFKPSFITGLKHKIILFMPFMNKFLFVPFVSSSVDKKMRSIINQVIKERKDDKKRPDDLLQVILDLKEKYGEKVYTENVVVGHSFTFLTEGFETSSTTMAFAIYQLALNEDIQKRAQLEVDAVISKCGGVFTEESIAELQYLESVLYETLRFHSPVFQLSKMNLKECEFPPQYESSTTCLTVEEDTICVIPVHSFHFDAEYYPNPHRFDPERFNKENKDSIPKYAFLGFGEGPRICLGMKFALTQTKVGVASILSKYNVEIYSKTENPIQYCKNVFILEPANGIWLKLTRRTKQKS
ncbi:unnamed protein product [Diamesa serratosioi]